MKFAGRYTLTVTPSGDLFQVQDALCGDALVYQGQDIQEALQGHTSPEALTWAAPHLQAMQEVSNAKRAEFAAREEADTQFRKALLRGEV